MKRPSLLVAAMIGSLVLPLVTDLSLAENLSPASANPAHESPKPVTKMIRIAASASRKVTRKTAQVVPAVRTTAVSVKRETRSMQVTPKAQTVRTIAVVTPPPAAALEVPVNTEPVKPVVEPDRLTAVDKAEMQDRHRTMAKQILGMLPLECQEQLKSFSVLYDNPKNRGLAGKGVIILSGNVPDSEFRGLLLHEGLGHFADLTCFNGSDAAGESAFVDGPQVMKNDDPSVAFYAISWTDSITKKSDARNDDFVSGYAVTDVFEDFAESVAYYELQEEAFTQRAQVNSALAQKLAWLRQYYPKNGRSIATGPSWDGKIPWDATKVAYALTDLR